MEERILRLCKRLNRTTLDELLPIAEDIDESELKRILIKLTYEGKLTQKGDSYIYKQIAKKPVSMIFQVHSKEIVDLIIKCFCSKIASNITCNIVGSSEETILKFYKYFRAELYNHQYQILTTNYSKDPQRARHCSFFEQEVYLYIYNNRVFVSETFIENSQNRLLNGVEVKEFRKIYSYLSRELTHRKNKYYLCTKIAEATWRRNKSFDEMYLSLRNILFS